jgi:hypothetical protein
MPTGDNDLMDAFVGPEAQAKAAEQSPENRQRQRKREELDKTKPLSPEGDRFGSALKRVTRRRRW